MLTTERYERRLWRHADPARPAVAPHDCDPSDETCPDPAGAWTPVPAIAVVPSNDRRRLAWHLPAMRPEARAQALAAARYGTRDRGASAW